MTQSSCPYCNSALKKRPSRKTKCPNCGKHIYVKRSPGETNKRLVTEQEAERIESMWESQNEESDYLQKLKMFNINKNEFSAMRQGLKPNFGSDQLNWNTAWTLLNNAILKEKNLHTKKMMCFTLAYMAEKRALDFRRYLRQAQLYDAMYYNEKNKAASITALEILSADHSCEACKLSDGKKYSIKDAIKIKPLPCEDCTCRGNGYCVCIYSPVIK